MSTLYLTEEGSSLHLKENRLQIKKTNDTLKEISIEKIDNIVLMGRCHITSPLATELLEREIPVSWLSSTLYLKYYFVVII